MMFKHRENSQTLYTLAFTKEGVEVYWEDSRGFTRTTKYTTESVLGFLKYGTWKPVYIFKDKMKALLKE